MERHRFLLEGAREENETYAVCIQRERDLYPREEDIRSPFARDYTRILHSLAYRRLKHKTQVFFNINNDHICTRMEHVSHVESVSGTIAAFLGLNTELTQAIAAGHDLGHAPFGHHGEMVLTTLGSRFGFQRFWHEQNGLHFVDDIELLKNGRDESENLSLTYGVRDGIISHCGEVDDTLLRPRKEAIDLRCFQHAGQFQPFTWEGCVVKISDKIAYLGRDIEDAVRLNFLTEKEYGKLKDIGKQFGMDTVNTTVLMHRFVSDICRCSLPEEGIKMSDDSMGLLQGIRQFNTEYIYHNRKFETYKKYADLVLTAIFETLMECYAKEDTFWKMEEIGRFHPTLTDDFCRWLAHFCLPEIIPESYRVSHRIERYQNKKIYGVLEEESVFAKAILDYIAGMTDRYAIDVFQDLLKY